MACKKHWVGADMRGFSAGEYEKGWKGKNKRGIASLCIKKPARERAGCLPAEVGSMLSPPTFILIGDLAAAGQGGYRGFVKGRT